MQPESDKSDFRLKSGSKAFSTGSEGVMKALVSNDEASECVMTYCLKTNYISVKDFKL